jgi:hypothetical protein
VQKAVVAYFKAIQLHLHGLTKVMHKNAYKNGCHLYSVPNINFYKMSPFLRKSIGLLKLKLKLN